MKLNESCLILVIILSTALAADFEVDGMGFCFKTEKEKCGTLSSVCYWSDEKNCCKCVPIKRSLAKRGTWCTTNDEERCNTVMKQNYLFHDKCEWLEDTRCCSCPIIYIGK